MIWGHNSTLNLTPLKKLKAVDLGDVSVIPTSIEHTMTAITSIASEIIKTGTKLISLGGDHSVTLPLLHAQAKKHGPVSLVHVDAHLDTRESEFEAVPYNHGTPFRHAINEGLIRKGEYVQIGIRRPVSGENDYDEAATLGACTITVHEVMQKYV